MDRKKHTFPTRQYPYKKENETDKNEAGITKYSIKTTDFYDPEKANSSKILKFILGIDAHPTPLKQDELENLGDSFAELALKKGIIPLTLNELLSILDQTGNEENGLPNQNSFLVADGGQIPWSQETNDLNRLFRFVVSRSDASGDVLLLISTSTLPNSKEQFLQLISWDKIHKAYNFYERRDDFWFWAGNSFHALSAPSRGKGPFDSHVNGALVMKELKFPWVHWHSMTASINDDALSPDDELRNEKLWLEKSGGQEFELQVAKPGVVKWNESRFEKNTDESNTLNNCKDFFRQVVTTTTINIITTKEESHSIDKESLVRIPETFFFNKDVLMDEVGLEPNISPVNFKGKHYLKSLEDFDFFIGNSEFRFKGDTHFAFLVPEPSFEDVNLISLLLSKGIVSKKFIASLLMVDFSNPIYSERRKSLLGYFPNEENTNNHSIELRFKSEVEKSQESKVEGTAEKLFLSNYNLPDDDWKETFEKQIELYFKNLHELIATKNGFYDIVRLAESRRREFRGTDLAEFRLTTPITNIPENALLLEITNTAIVQPK